MSDTHRPEWSVVSKPPSLTATSRRLAGYERGVEASAGGRRRRRRGVVVVVGGFNEGAVPAFISLPFDSPSLFAGRQPDEVSSETLSVILIALRGGWHREKVGALCRGR